MSFNLWCIGLSALIITMFITLIHIFQALFAKVELHDGGSGFEVCTNFSSDIQEKLIQNYTRIQGTLLFWKNKAALYGRLHKHAVSWSIASSYLIPVLIQNFNPANDCSKWFLTILPAFSGILIAFSKGFKAEELYRNYRMGESEFFDVRRRLLDIPLSLGKTEEEQVNKYFEQVEKIRRLARDGELNNPPTANPV